MEALAVPVLRIRWVGGDQEAVEAKQVVPVGPLTQVVLEAGVTPVVVEEQVTPVLPVTLVMLDHRLLLIVRLFPRVLATPSRLHLEGRLRFHGIRNKIY